MMKQISYTWMAFVVGLALAASSPASAQESKLFEVLERGKVIVGVTSEVPPFGSIENGELVVGSWSASTSTSRS